MDKGKAIIKKYPKKLDAKRCFKCPGYGHFKADCPSGRATTIKKIEEVKINFKDEEIDEQTTVQAIDMG